MQLAAVGAGLGPLALSVIASVIAAGVMILVRIFVMQRMQQQRQRENRQEAERLRRLVAAYRSMAGSFSPATDEHKDQLEESLADIVLFGSLSQVEMAAQCANAIAAGESVSLQPLIESLRADLRIQLGLEAVPNTLILPAAGPGRTPVRGGGEGRRGGRDE